MPPSPGSDRVKKLKFKKNETFYKITPNVYRSATRFNLGPLLLSININDLPKTCPKLNCIIYADDTTL